MTYNKAVIKMTNGNDYTITGPIVNDLYEAINADREGATISRNIGWVSVRSHAINMKYAENIVFTKEESVCH